MDKAKIFLEDGNEKIVNCIFYLYNSKYYFLYTLNEIDENGYVRLYLVKVGKETATTESGSVETGNMVGIEVPTDEEWKEVQGSISKIVNSKKTKTEEKEIQYLPINMLVNLKIVSKKTFRLLANIIEGDFDVNLKEELNTLESNPVLSDPNIDKPIETNENQLAEPLVNIGEHLQDTSSPIENTTDDPNEPVVNKPIENTEEKESEETVVENTTEETPLSTEDSANTNEENLPLDNNEISETENTDSDYNNSDIILDYRTRFFEE